MRKVLRCLIVGTFLFLFWPLFFYQTHGKKTANFSKNSLIVANHYSNLDPFLIYLFCKKKKDLYFITNVGVKKNPFTRIFCYAFNCLYVDGDDPFKNLGVLKESISLLKKGKIIVIFPEGVIRPCKNGFLEFNRGFAFLAKKAKSTIYPIYLYPVVFPFKRSQIYIGDPILFETIKEKSDLEISMMVQAIVMDLSLQAEKDGKTK